MNETPNAEHIEKLIKETPDLKGNADIQGFCTVFKKKKNKPLFTFDVLYGFNEEHGKALCIMKGAMGEISPKMFDVLKEFVNKTGELDISAKLLIEDFDKHFRILVGSK